VSDDRGGNADFPAQGIVRKLLRVGANLPAELKREILGLGPSAVPWLIDLVNDRDLLDGRSKGDASAPVHAVELLAELKATEAAEPLIRLMGDTGPLSWAHDRCILALPKLGAAIVEPALRAYDDTSDAEFRTSLCAVLAEAGVKDDRILDRLLELLQRHPDAGAGDLADYGDERALPFLLEAFDRQPVRETENPLANHVFIELREAIARLDGTLSPAQVAKFERAMQPADRWRQQMRATLGEEEPPRGPQRRVKVGRNEPCWCGSGKKYKKCHLVADEGH
jgi:hypothetical protein